MGTQRARSVLPGRPFPLGATPLSGGVNFALFSRNATEVTVELFDSVQDPMPSASIRLPRRTRFVWHGFVEGIGPGQLYAFRVDGPYRPEEGHRFNRNRLLLDPYARAITGKFAPWPACHLGYDPLSPLQDLTFNTQDNAAFAPRCVALEDAFDWDGDTSPGYDMSDLVIYETHVKGLTATLPGCGHPGTFLGVEDAIPHLLALGVNAVELLPVHECHMDDAVLAKGLTNYWGYNTLGYFAPDGRFAAGSQPGCQVDEFRHMVRELHRAGIEVILDVVYNHTGEGSQLGPTFCFRGIDNASYYALSPADRRFNMDYTGCGNSLNFDEPQVVRLVMDSLRYWVEAMHVDGFRFDLASTLGRHVGRFDQVSAFFTAVHQDPVISRVKLIAEPWDVGSDSYQVGNFPVDWAEWNGRYRDCVRRFAKGDPGRVPELASRILGSADLYGDDGRTPYHSVNFVTCHDGFTLWDLVSHSRKHNEANGEENRDGCDDNASWNWGVEGPTDDPTVLATRRRVAKGLMATLLLSQGVPMILGGDEFLRTQRGNNNAYCQDGPISWLDWSLLEKETAFLTFCRRLLDFRHSQPALRRRCYYTGEDKDLDSIADVTWYGPDLSSPRWTDPELRTVALRLEGSELEDGKGPDLFLIFHAHWEPYVQTLSPGRDGWKWKLAVDTGLPEGEEVAISGKETLLEPQDRYFVSPRSVVVLVAG